LILIVEIIPLHPSSNKCGFFCLRVQELEMNMESPMSQNEKEKVFREFDKQCEKFVHKYCSCCMQVAINLNIGKNGICSECSPHRNSQYLLNCNALPVWYDNNIPQYHIPTELACLSVAEKMLIQQISPFIPLQHIKQGVFGINGHVCSFEQDIDEFVNSLPRQKNDVQMLRVLKSVRAEIGSDIDGVVSEVFKVRKAKVGAALRWLKVHNSEYKSVRIDMSALDWLEGEEGNLESATIQDSNPEQRDQDSDMGPCPNLTRLGELSGDVEMSFGFVEDCAKTVLSPDDVTIHNTLVEETALRRKTLEVAWPNRGPVATDEYKTAKLFAKAYPWLFPGGMGDLDDFPGGDCRKWGRHLIHYKDGRFTKDKFFCFFALNYITRQRNASSGNWFIKDFNKGGPKTLQDL
jgi:hypothetical protein